MNFPLCLFQNGTKSSQFLLLLLNSLHGLQLHLREDRNLSFVGLFFFNNFIEFLLFLSHYLSQCRIVLSCCHLSHQIFLISLDTMQIVLHAVLSLTEGNRIQSTLWATDRTGSSIVGRENFKYCNTSLSQNQVTI